MKDQQYQYKKDKNKVKSSRDTGNPDDDVYVEETLHVVTL